MLVRIRNVAPAQHQAGQRRISQSDRIICQVAKNKPVELLGRGADGRHRLIIGVGKIARMIWLISDRTRSATSCFQPKSVTSMSKSGHRWNTQDVRAIHGRPGEPAMLDRSLEAEFASYRKTLATDDARRTFDERIERLLSQHGVDYVRGYVDALKDTSSAGY
jgi:hypothetical protein